jgi:hypothetical protein
VVTSLNDKLKFIEAVLGKGVLSRDSRNFDVRCPIPECESRRDKGKVKLSIRTDDFRNHCWVCGWTAHTLAPIIRKYGTREQMVDYRERIHPTANWSRKEDVAGSPIVRLPADFQLLATSTSMHPDVKALRLYLTRRGLNENDFWYYKFGYSSEFRWRRRVIMPSFDARGSLNYFVARAVDPDRPKRYDNADAIKTEIVFNEINIDWTQRLVLCEGPFDMVKCGENVAPLLGNTLREESALFCAIITNTTPVAIALDSTETKKALRLAAKFAEYDVPAAIIDVTPFKDPGEMTKQEFQEALERSITTDWGSRLSAKLNMATDVSLRVNG